MKKMADAVADGGLTGAGNINTCVYNPVDTNGHPNHAGCHDEGAAIQAMLTAAGAAGSIEKNIFFKPFTAISTQYCDYYSSIALTVPAGVNLIGGGANIGKPTVICFARGVGGMKGGGYQTLDGLRLEGGDWWIAGSINTYVLPTLGGVGPNPDGLILGGHTKASNITVQGFGRHCITFDSVQTGGSDAIGISNISVGSCRGDGINFNGSDAQVGSISVVGSGSNQLYGIRGNGFSNYGNTIINPNTQGNHNANGLTGTPMAGTFAFACTAATAVQLTGSCTVTESSANTMYANDRVTFAGMSDAGLNATFVVSSSADNTHFVIPYNVTETLSSGGSGTYNPGYHLWAAAGTSGNGGNYGQTSGSQLYLGCYSETSDTMGSFSDGVHYSFCINPQGTIPLDGIVITNYYSNIMFDEPMVIHESVAAPALGTRFNGFNDNYNSTFATLYNMKPIGSFGGAGFAVYSKLQIGERLPWGNSSGWWCTAAPGNDGTTMNVADVCYKDDLTVTGRTNVDARGASLFPNGFFQGNPTTGLTYYGWGSAAPSTGVDEGRYRLQQRAGRLSSE